MSKVRPKLTVKASEAELEFWKEAAFTRRVSLSEWVRRVLTATAEQTTGKTAPERQI